MSDEAPNPSTLQDPLASLLARSQRLPEDAEPLGLPSTPQRVPQSASGPTRGVSVDAPRGRKYKVVRVVRESGLCLGRIGSGEIVCLKEDAKCTTKHEGGDSIDVSSEEARY
jgi:hypothetical protein